MPAATFTDGFAHEFLKCITTASAWTSTSTERALNYDSGMYAVLLSTTNNGLSSYASNAAKVIAYTNVATWSTAVAGAKQVDYVFSSVQNAGVPAECHIAHLSGGTFYPVCVGAVTPSGGGGMLIGSTASYSSGERTYRGVLTVPADNGGTLRLNTALRDALLDKMVAGGNFLGFGNQGTLSFYDGTQPASADDAVPGASTLLASHTMTSGWTTPTSRRTTYPYLTATLDNSADASGTATWARMAYGTYKMDFGVGASSGDIVIPTAFVAGASKTWDIGAITLIWP